MYHKSFGIIETVAPLHVGASAGEETGNLNLIFRDQFTQTGIIPGSSIRGRFRAYARAQDPTEAHTWYGHEAVAGQTDGGTTESQVKFEYASIIWLPIFCPGQPVVWVTCPRLLSRYKRIAGISANLPKPYTASSGLSGRKIPNSNKSILFFNLGFLELEHKADLTPWIPTACTVPPNQTVVVADNDIAMIHDMGLYRQSRVKLLDEMKKVDTEKGAFFNVEALPEGCVMVFPVAVKEKGWDPFNGTETEELYFGGLESVGFGACQVTLNH